MTIVCLSMCGLLNLVGTETRRRSDTHTGGETGTELSPGGGLLEHSHRLAMLHRTKIEFQTEIGQDQDFLTKKKKRKRKRKE